jgi:biopolymer transport protein ExbD
MAISVQADSLPSDEEPSEAVVAEINITPLTDVFLVLLIIALVALTASSDRAVPREGVAITPPRADTAQAIRKDNAPVLAVTRTGEIYLDRKKVELPALEAELRQALKDRQSDTVLVSGDTSAQLGTAVRVMSLARKAGARTINVLTAPANSP